MQPTVTFQQTVLEKGDIHIQKGEIESLSLNTLWDISKEVVIFIRFMLVRKEQQWPATYKDVEESRVSS